MFTLPLYDDNPTTITPFVTWTMIALCTLAYLWQASLTPGEEKAVAYALGLVPAVLFGFAELPPRLAVVPPEVTLVTSMFLHGGWMHLIGNMLYLWIFGDNVEDSMGHVRFLVFYVLCGVAAALAQALPDPNSEIPMVGASGAISGVLGAYVLLHPHAKVLVAIPLGFILQTMRLPASVVLVLWFGLQLLSNTMSQGGGGVAFRAHIGGFIAGMLLVGIFKRRDVKLFAPAR
jgi:membrane associated rhomboid family serine protease